VIRSIECSLRRRNSISLVLVTADLTLRPDDVESIDAHP
jgi:hypothetical protein